jgi:hypothetical protein
LLLEHHLNIRICQIQHEVLAFGLLP